METLVSYLVDHNAQVVSALVLAIILLSMILGFRSFLNAKNAEKFGGTEGASMGQLEETLKKLLERAGEVPTAAQAGAGVSAENTALLKEIEDLRNTLAEKQVQIELIERKNSAEGNAVAEAAPSGSGLSDADKEALSTQIKDLQARLAEYEIISEDIADLSFFREENAKLQKELEALKKTGAPAAGSAPVAARPAAAEAAPVVAAAAVAAAEPPASAPVIDPEVDFGQELVDKLLDQANSISAPITDTVAESAPPPVAPEPAAPPSVEASAIGKPEDLDVEKMVAEAAALNVNSVHEEKNALEEHLDSDKLLAEAAGMDGKINPEDAKLMGEFEDFMKKGGVG